MTVMNAKMSAVGSQVMRGSDLIGSSCSDVFGTKDSVNNTVNSQSVADLLPGRPLTSQTFTLRYSIFFNIHVHSPSIRGLQQLLVLFCWRDKHVETENNRLIEKQHATVTPLRRMDGWISMFVRHQRAKVVFCLWVQLKRKCVKVSFFFIRQTFSSLKSSGCAGPLRRYRTGILRVRWFHPKSSNLPTSIVMFSAQRAKCVLPTKKKTKKQPDKEIKERLPVDSQPVSAGFHMRGTAGGQFP